MEWNCKRACSVLDEAYDTQSALEAIYKVFCYMQGMDDELIECAKRHNVGRVAFCNEFSGEYIMSQCFKNSELHSRVRTEL